MHTLRFFAFFRSDRPRARNLWYFFMLTLSVVFSCLLFLTPSVHGAQTHSCAPDTPPPVSGPLNTTAAVQINEVLTQPNSKWICTGTSNSWIELYNSQSQPIDLYEQRTIIFINDAKGADEYLLPFGTSIAAKEFLVLFPLEHVNATSIVSVTLVMNSITIDQVTIPALQADQSYARIPDGIGNWQIVDQPTIDASNDTPGQTATAAPTLTSIALTRTPKPTSTSTRTGTHTGGSTPTGLGTQPAWNQVKLPPGVTPTAATATLADASTPPSASQPQNPPVAQNGRWRLALDNIHKGV